MHKILLSPQFCNPCDQLLPLLFPPPREEPRVPASKIQTEGKFGKVFSISPTYTNRPHPLPPLLRIAATQGRMLGGKHPPIQTSLPRPMPHDYKGIPCVFLAANEHEPQHAQLLGLAALLSALPPTFFLLFFGAAVLTLLSFSCLKKSGGAGGMERFFLKENPPDLIKAVADSCRFFLGICNLSCGILAPVPPVQRQAWGLIGLKLEKCKTERFLGGELVSQTKAGEIVLPKASF